MEALDFKGCLDLAKGAARRNEELECQKLNLAERWPKETFGEGLLQQREQCFKLKSCACLAQFSKGMACQYLWQKAKSIWQKEQ